MSELGCSRSGDEHERTWRSALLRGPPQPAHHEALSLVAKAAGSAGTSPSRICACSNSSADESADLVVAARLGAAERLHQIGWRMLSSRIGLAPRRGSGARQQALELAVGALRAGDQAGGAVGQALRGAHVGDALAQRLLHGGDHRRVVDRLGGGSSLGRLVSSSGTRPKSTSPWLSDLQRLALEVLRHRGPERIDRIGQQQHLDAARARRLELRIGLQPLGAVADEVIDLGLVGLEVGDVLLERARRIAGGRGEAREREQLAAPLVILVDALP